MLSLTAVWPPAWHSGPAVAIDVDAIPGRDEVFPAVHRRDRRQFPGKFGRGRIRYGDRRPAPPTRVQSG